MGASLLLVLAAVPEVRYWNSRKVKVTYSVEDATGVGKVELWVTADEGKTWAKACEDEDLTSPVEFTARTDGRYGFAFVMEDKVGNRSPEPKSGRAPSRVLVMDTSPPEVSVSLSGRFAGPGKAVTVRWSCADPNLRASPASLHLVSPEGERLLGDSLEPSGSFEWRPAPRLQGEFRFVARASDLAGNVSRTESGRVTADPVPPRAAVAPPEKAATDVLSVELRAEDEGGSGLAEVMLFASADGGKTWRLVARGDPDARRLSFRVRPGDWWLCAGAVDNSGNSTPGPVAQARVTVEKPPLRLVILEEPPSLRGGDRFKLRWRCEPAGAKLERGVDVYWRPSPDGGWVPVARSRPPDGELGWKAPEEDCDKAQFRLQAQGPGSGTASVLSREFIVDASAPVAVLDFDLGEGTPTVPRESPRAAAVATTGEEPQVAPMEKPEPEKRAPDAESVRSLLEAGEFAEAARLASSLLSSNPADGRALVLRARAKALAGDLDGAEADLMRASALPGAARAKVLLPRVLLAKAALSWEDKRRSLRYAKLALDAAGGALTVEGLVSTGLACYMRASLGGPPGAASPGGGPEELLRKARENLERALSTSPGELEGICRWYLARIMEAQGNPRAAGEHWRRAAELFPEGSSQKKFAESKVSP